MTEWIHTIIALAVFIGGLFGAVAKVSWIVRGALVDMKAEFNALLQLKEAEFEGKIGKVWERFDVYKNTCDLTFIRREACELTHSATRDVFVAHKESIDEVKVEVKTLNTKMDGLILALATKKNGD